LSSLFYPIKHNIIHKFSRNIVKENIDQKEFLELIQQEFANAKKGIEEDIYDKYIGSLTPYEKICFDFGLKG